MKIVRRVVLLGVLSGFVGWSAASDSSKASEALRLVAQGDSLFAGDRWEEAKRAYRKALRKDSEQIKAMEGLGSIALEREKWEEAKDWQGRILKQEPENIDALYRRAICFRETSKFKALAARRLDWWRAEKLFRKVLEIDSLYQDVLYQYGRLKRCRGQYTEAILLGHRQVALKPDLVEGQRGLFRLYGFFLDNHSGQKARAWLEAHGSEHDRYFIGETLRRDGRLDEADSILRSWLASNPSISAVPALLSLARLCYEREDPRAAEAFFWNAVDSIRHRLDAELVFEDVKYVVNEGERQAFKDCASPEGYVDFFRNFWIRRDPTPAEETNVRLEEHYRRMVYAEEYYVYDGFRTWFNNPDKGHSLDFPPPFYLNDRFNDKGLIYIRHGEPRENAQTLGEHILVNDSWYYGKSDTLSEAVFHFVIDENASGNNWRVTPFPPSVSGRETWGSAYQRRGRRGRGNPLRRLAIEQEFTAQSQSAVATGFRTDRHSWDRDVDPLDIDSYLAYFKAPEGKTAFHLFYGLSLPSDKALEAARDTSLFYEYGLALHDLEWNLVERHQGQVTKGEIERLKHERMWVGQYRFTIEPDSCHAAFYLGEPDRKHLGGWKGGIRISEFSETALGVSSIVPAYEISPDADTTAIFQDGLRLVPNPSTRFRRKKPVYVYFEVYNLTPDAEGTTAYVIEYTVSLQKKKGTIQKLFSLFGNDAKPSTSVTVERRGDRPSSAEYLSLDLSRAGRGDFRLDVRVTDRRSGEESESSMDLVLF